MRRDHCVSNIKYPRLIHMLLLFIFSPYLQDVFKEQELAIRKHSILNLNVELQGQGMKSLKLAERQKGLAGALLRSRIKNEKD